MKEYSGKLYKGDGENVVWVNNTIEGEFDRDGDKTPEWLL